MRRCHRFSHGTSGDEQWMVAKFIIMMLYYSHPDNTATMELRSPWDSLKSFVTAN